MERNLLIQHLIEDPEVKRILSRLARRRQLPEAVLRRNAITILREITSDLKPKYAKFSYRLVQWIWTRLYRQRFVDEAGLQQLLRIAQDHPVILTPSHRSHMDYLLLAALLHEQGLPPPYVAAGINLSFWPLGPLFRKNGAYFIRRTIPKDLLYPKLLAAYVLWLVRNNCMQEIFIEGGRSRTGRLNFPKHGLLSIQVEAVVESAVQDLYVVPVAVTYERVLEEESYRAEVSGSKKKRENIWLILRARHLLGRSHGDVHVRFGTPISIRSFLDLDSGRKISLRDQKEKVAQLCMDILGSVAKKTVVTPVALVALAILNQTSNEISESNLATEIETFQNYLIQMNAPIAAEVRQIPFPLKATTQKLNDWLNPIQSDPDTRYYIPSESRIVMDYYKNTILPHFLSVAIAAAAFDSKSRDMEEDRAFLLCEILAYEFPQQFDSKSILKEERPRIKAMSERDRMYFSGIIMNYIESYNLACQFSLETGVSAPVNSEVIQKVQQRGVELLGTPSLRRPEALSAITLKNAFSLLQAKNLLAEKSGLKEWQNKLKIYGTTVESCDRNSTPSPM